MPVPASEIKTFADPAALAKGAAHEFVLQAREAIEARGSFSVALSGGSTPKALYALLASDVYRDQVNWERIHFFWGDERHVPPDDPDSNYRMANERLLSPLSLPDSNIHRVYAEEPDAAQAASEYEAQLRQFFKLTGPELPRFDLIMLGMGPDGHTASLFPGTPLVHERERLVAAPWVAKFNTFRITFTPPVINNARHILFFVTGEEKAQTLKSVLEGEFQPEQFPSQIVRPTDGTLLWMVDEAAEKLL